MMNKKSLKSTLLMSGVSILLSGAMLVGTTFAWFHDTAESAENTITAGTLDVDLEYNSENITGAGDANWKSAKDTPIFKPEDTQKWEPGKMVFSYPIRIVNKGTKALKYKITVKTVEDSDNLSEVILSTVIAYPTGNLSSITDRDSEWTKYTAPDADKSEGTLEKTLNSDALAVVLYWQPTENDGKYNSEDGSAPSFKFTVDVYATQAASESDSVGPKYDEETPLPADLTTQSQEVKRAVTTGVTDVNDFASVLKEQTKNEPEGNKFVGELTVSEVQYNNDNGKYESTLTFKEMDGTSTMIGICGIVGLLHNAVVEQKSNIDTITIDGMEIDAEVIQALQKVEGDAKTDPKTFGGNALMAVVGGKEDDDASTGPAWLLAPLLKWAQNYKVGLGELIGGQIEGLSGHACDVVITDKLGNAVTYSLAFNIDSPIKANP